MRRIGWLIAVIVLCVVALVLTVVDIVAAEDRQVTILWAHDGRTTNGDPVTLGHFVVGWGLQSGPPYPTLIHVDGGTARHHILPLTNLSPGDVLHLNVKACNTNNQCSDWASEVAHAIVPDAQFVNERPAYPTNVTIIIQSTSLP